MLFAHLHKLHLHSHKHKERGFDLKIYNGAKVSSEYLKVVLES